MKIVILGAGQIGSACKKLIEELGHTCEVWDKIGSNPLDIDLMSVENLKEKLLSVSATHVMVALPFLYNEKVAQAAVGTGCHYIDFTEDDEMSDKVQEIYRPFENLFCVTKCGLAPGIINYIGLNLVDDLKELIGPDGKCTDLVIGVGALPINVRGNNPEDLYSLSWSVDGLVNEYIRLCRIRWKGNEHKVSPLTGLEKILIDGTEYEAACTSGGIGSLVKDLRDVENVCYKTIRYPGHYKYVTESVTRHWGDFEAIKKEFLSVFPFDTNDVIVTYAEAKGSDGKGRNFKRTYSSKFYGRDGLSAIQTTTATGGVGILELMTLKVLKPGIISHSDIKWYDFRNTTVANKLFNH